MRARLVASLALAGGAMASCAAAADAANVCDGGPRSCTRVAVALDRSGGVPGTLSLHVELAQARRPVRPPLFVLAGEPGASNSRSGLLWEAMIGDESDARDVVVMDLRGTGRSGALRCPSLENGRRHDAAAGAACSAALGPRRAFYTAADSAADIDAVRQSLGAPRIALLGMAYGTRAAMEYARRYPANVERLVLDSPVGPDGLDALRRNAAQAAPRVLRRLCRRGRCRAWTRDVAADLDRLAARLERRPLRGLFTDRHGRRHPRSLGSAGLFEALLAGDANPFVRQATPAAIDEALHGDPAPLLRLAERAAEGHGFRKPREVSAGAYAVALCEDSALPWAPETPPAQRRSRASALVAGLPAGALGPFGPRVALTGPAVELCERWPSSARRIPPAGPFPRVPAVVLAGADDNRNPVADARAVAARIPGSRLLVLPSAYGDGVLEGAGHDCRSRALARFLAGGAATRCAAPRALGRPFPPTSKDLGRRRPAGLGGRPGRTVAALRANLAKGVVELYGELLSALVVRQDAGNPYASTLRAGALRGGSYAVDIPRNVYVLRRASLVRGMHVSGWLTEHADVDNDLAKGEGRLRIGGPAAARGTLTVRRGVMAGRLGRREVRMRLFPRGERLSGFADVGR